MKTVYLIRNYEIRCIQFALYMSGGRQNKEYNLKKMMYIVLACLGYHNKNPKLV